MLNQVLPGKRLQIRFRLKLIIFTQRYMIAPMRKWEFYHVNVDTLSDIRTF